MTFTLPTLKYEYSSLEPAIDEKTMETHHSKHHAAYITNLNTALEKYEDLKSKSIEDLLLNLNTLPGEIITTVRNNGGGHYNHALFWEIMTPKQEVVEPVDTLKGEINNSFGSFDNFKAEFTKTALGVFGSGWAWLALDPQKKLYITSKPNQENPLMDGSNPIMGLDVWEHAYYLNYQNRRAEYISNWWNVVDWVTLEQKYAKEMSR